ncbi:polysaccharide ABC transporter ATP-binding protein [Mariprofundus ferrooxydans]|uniref:ABC transporter ATP-binding protein n=1 Tax=Mariprofundus ferrooxydans TaxID=314344 RepID=UPI00197D10F0|nr:ABC transporter ATP-binding protein [Mariprofundus ferrooxydans]
MRNSQDSSTTTQVLDEGALVKVEGVSKKFCRSLKKSLWYGVQDLGREITGRRNSGEETLRKDEFWSVNDISFELKRGECIGIIGHNGAGKSTLLKMLNGLIKPDKGKITMRGRVGALIELGAGFNPILTGRENVYVNGQVLGFTKKEIDVKFDEIVAFAEIEKFIDMPVQNYSSGMRVRLGFAVAAQMEPDILILDEVLAVGDQGFQIKCLNRIHELLGKSAVIFVTHSMPFVSLICSKSLVMHNGNNICYSLDVPKGIAVYNSEFNTGERNMLGNGEVIIENLSINSKACYDRPEIEFGEGIKLSFDARVVSTCDTLSVRVSIWNIQHRPVAEALKDNLNVFQWKNNSSLVSLEVNIKSLLLPQGSYSITIIILDNCMRTLCRVDNALAFVVNGGVATGCDSYITADWNRLS